MRLSRRLSPVSRGSARSRSASPRPIPGRFDCLARPQTCTKTSCSASRRGAVPDNPNQAGGSCGAFAHRVTEMPVCRLRAAVSSRATSGSDSELLDSPILKRYAAAARQDAREICISLYPPGEPGSPDQSRCHGHGRIMRRAYCGLRLRNQGAGNAITTIASCANSTPS